MKTKKPTMRLRFVIFLIVLAFLTAQGSFVFAVPFTSTFKVLLDNGSRDQNISATIPTSDDGYIQVGTLANRGSSYCNYAFILKFDSKGNILWNKTFRAAKDENTLDSGGFTTVCELDDKSLIAVGAAGNDTFMVKFSKFGDIIWQKTYSKPEGNLAMVANDITEKENCIEIVGHVWGGGKHAQFFFLKIDTNGTIKEENIVGGAHEDAIIKHTSDGGYMTLVRRLGNGWTNDFSKYDENLNRQWTANLDNYLNWPVIGEVSDGFTLFATANVNSGEPPLGMCAFKFSESGQLIYKKVFKDIIIKGGSFDSRMPVSTSESSNSGSYIGLKSGMTTVDGVILGLSPEGTLKSTVALGGRLPASIIDDEGELVVSSHGIFQKINPSSAGSVVVKSTMEVPFAVAVIQGIAIKDDANNLSPADASIYNKYTAPKDVNYYNSKIVGFTQIGGAGVTSDTIYPSTKSLLVVKGKTQQVKVYMNVDGNKKDVTSECTYKVSNKSMISVSKTGIVKGLKKGVCKLTISRKGKTINMNVNVK